MDESPAESVADLDALQSRMVSQSKEAMDAVSERGLRIEEAAGAAEYCGLQPDPGVTYSTGIRLAQGSGGDDATQVAAVRDSLVELGWTVDSESDDPAPHVSLTRDDLRASVDVSRRQDQPGVVFGLSADCLSVGDDYTLPDDRARTDLLQQ